MHTRIKNNFQSSKRLFFGAFFLATIVATTVLFLLLFSIGIFAILTKSYKQPLNRRSIFGPK